LLLWGVLFVALSRLASSAEPVFEEDPLLAVEARPQRVRDGPLVMVDLTGGQFFIGSPDTDEMASDNEKPQHTVTVSGFRITVTSVTAGLYNEVMQKEPVPEGEARRPAAGVTWYNVVEFCNRLSVCEGYRPCYRQRFKRWICD
jgi:formylglycine-generating enzyme required for sulfatase activity